jgi:hypothetical protein
MNLMFFVLVILYVSCQDASETVGAGNAARQPAAVATLAADELQQAADSELGNVFLSEHVPSKIIGLKAKVRQYSFCVCC